MSSSSKAELPNVGIFFALKFLPLSINKLEIEKTKNTQYTTFKTDIIKVVLVSSISNFFTDKNSRQCNLAALRLVKRFIPITKNTVLFSQYHNSQESSSKVAQSLVTWCNEITTKSLDALRTLKNRSLTMYRS